MRLEYYPVEKLKREVRKIASKYLDLEKYKLFFFGSRVVNKGTERSDIDIGIEGPTPIPALILSNMEEELEQLPILYKIEIVDFTCVDAKFKKVAKQKIETVN